MYSCWLAGEGGGEIRGADARTTDFHGFCRHLLRASAFGRVFRSRFVTDESMRIDSRSLLPVDEAVARARALPFSPSVTYCVRAIPPLA